MNRWQIGQVRVTQVVEIGPVPTSPQVLLQGPAAGPGGAPPLAEAALRRCAGPAAAVDPLLRHRVRRPAHRRRHLRRQRQAAPPPRLEPAARAASCRTWRPPASRPRHDRHGAVHPPARRPRRLEHALGRRPLGADLPERALPVRAQGVGALVGRAAAAARRRGRRRHPRRLGAADPRRRPGRPGRHRPPADRRGAPRADAGPHAGPCQRAHRIRGPARGDHRRPDAPPDAVQRAGPHRATSTPTATSRAPPAATSWPAAPPTARWCSARTSRIRPPATWCRPARSGASRYCDDGRHAAAAVCADQRHPHGLLRGRAEDRQRRRWCCATAGRRSPFPGGTRSRRWRRPASASSRRTSAATAPPTARSRSRPTTWSS